MKVFFFSTIEKKTYETFGVFVFVAVMISLFEIYKAEEK